MRQATPDNVLLLQSWLQSNHVWWNQELMRFAEATNSDDSAGIGLWAIKSVCDGDHLCSIPKAALLSIRTTEISDVLELEQLGGGLALSFTVCFERARGQDSQWCDPPVHQYRFNLAIVFTRLSIALQAVRWHQPSPGHVGRHIAASKRHYLMPKSLSGRLTKNELV
jgi:hypothetical protein